MARKVDELAAYWGFDRVIEVRPTGESCPNCQGKGVLPGSTEYSRRLCKRCRGKGTV